MPTPPSITGLAHVILFVRDVPASAAFFRERLGILPKAGQQENPEWMELDTGSPALALHRLDGPPPPCVRGVPELVFGATDILRTWKELREAGLEIKEPVAVCEAGPRVGLSATFHDLDGNHLSLFGFVPKESWKGAIRS